MAEIYYEPTGCNCDGKDYSQADINGAATKALELASQGQTLGTTPPLPTPQATITVTSNLPTNPPSQAETSTHVTSPDTQTSLVLQPRIPQLPLPPTNHPNPPTDAYNDYEHFSFSHAQAPYLEFPILSSGHIYTGASPGADRVILGSIAEDFSSAIYCAVITHDGQRKNGFAECADDTVNLRGKGTFVSKCGKGVGREAVKEGVVGEKGGDWRGRKLIGRIDLSGE